MNVGKNVNIDITKDNGNIYYIPDMVFKYLIFTFIIYNLYIYNCMLNSSCLIAKKP
jgi:hypothetical protein